MKFIERVKQLEENGKLPSNIVSTLEAFYGSYESAIRSNQGDVEKMHPLLIQFLEIVLQQLKKPFQFGTYHRRITQPDNLYRLGVDFIAPVIKIDESSVIGLENVDQIQEKIELGENVILFANHQIEPDPQAISLILEKTHPELAEEMIFVAGHRVITDPLAVPFSMGRNLLCIYSKNYIDHPPEKKLEKTSHNQQAIRKMRELLSEGGKCIYVAPSGGRDRPNEKGEIEIAPFDPQSIEMFLLTAKHSSKPTHFYPLALSTFNLLPPPDRIKSQLGESRLTQSTPIHLAFGSPIETESFPGSDITDKKERRIHRANHIYNLVKNLYESIR